LDFGYISKKRRTPLFGIKNEERHENVAKFPRFWVYLQKRKEHHFLGLKIKKSNKKMAKTIEFWVYLQKKKNPYSWVTECRKTTKYSKSGNPLDKPTKTLYFRVTTRSKPMFSKIFLPSINSLRIITKK